VNTFPFLGSGAVEFVECRKRQHIRPNHARTALLCSIYCCLVLFSVFILPFTFSEVETASEMTKTMLEWVFLLTHISEYHISELTVTVYAVTESKNI